MTKDPIVAEVRQAGIDMAKEAGDDPHKFFANLRNNQAKYKDRLVRTVPKKEHATA